VTDWLAGCCHPTGGPHGRGEPDTCCHIHVEDLPSNRRAQQGETPQPPTGWTAQEQHLEDELSQADAEAVEPRERPVHQHRI
jgi:hypothetical protein